jgi:predicted nucleic acid-binding protein
VVQPFDLDIAEKLQSILRKIVPDMPDRMIAATALHLNLPLVTADEQIRASNIQTI